MDKYFKKVAPALFMLALTGGVAHATSVPTTSLAVTTAYQNNPLITHKNQSPEYYLLNLGSTEAGDTFDLNIELAPATPQSDSQTVTYSIYSYDSGSTSFNSSTPVATDTLTYLGNSGTAEFATLSWALESGMGYILKISLSGSASTSHTFFKGAEVSAVPVPGAALLFGTALLGAGALYRRGKKGQKAGAGLPAAAA